MHTAIIFQIQGKPEADVTKEDLWAMAKEAALKEIKGFPYTVEMPCGHSLTIVSPAELMKLPIEDVPCPCGDPEHYLIQFRDLSE